MTTDTFDGWAFDDVQVRSAEVVEIGRETGNVTAKLAPYDVEGQLADDLYEVFTRGAFSRSISNPTRIKVTDQGHNGAAGPRGGNVIGCAINLRDEADGVYGDLHISDTVAGRDVLTLLHDEALDQLSVEFRAQRRYMRVVRRDSGVLVRHDRAVLVGVSPVAAGVYGEAARVLSVRDAERDRERERAIAHLAALTSGA